MAKSETLPTVIESTENDNLFVFWSGHGVPGAMCWDEEPYAMTGDDLSTVLRI